MRKHNYNFAKIKNYYLKFIQKQEVLGEPFFDKIGQLKNYYLPISEKIYRENKRKKKITVLGLSGAQGTGKSTISQIIKIILKKKYNLNSVCFSIDDFYKTLKERKKMAKNIHQLFLTRGVPGTHDTKLLQNTFKGLLKKNFKPISIPRFDKSTDDRVNKKIWLKIKKKPDIIIFEGWCVGALSQNNLRLKKSINKLEKKYDKNLIWRIRVNNEIKKNYKKIFKLIDSLIFLKVPGFKHVYKWRFLQERKLKLKSKGSKVMNREKIKKFIMFYERITRQMITDLQSKANIVIKLDKKHRLCGIKFN